MRTSVAEHSRSYPFAAVKAAKTEELRREVAVENLRVEIAVAEWAGEFLRMPRAELLGEA